MLRLLIRRASGGCESSRVFYRLAPIFCFGEGTPPVLPRQKAAEGKESRLVGLVNSGGLGRSPSRRAGCFSDELKRRERHHSPLGCWSEIFLRKTRQRRTKVSMAGISQEFITQLADNWPAFVYIALSLGFSICYFLERRGERAAICARFDQLESLIQRSGVSSPETLSSSRPSSQSSRPSSR